MSIEWPFILCCSLVFNAPPAAITALDRSRADTSSPAETRMEEYLRARLGEDSRLYNGREYIRNGTPGIGFANFQWDSLEQGTLVYDDIFYPAIPLEYDLLQDRLVTPDRNSNLLISLVAARAPWFSIGSAKFRYVGSEPGLPEPGFYQELFSGPAVTLLARKRKTLVHPTTQEGQVRYVEVDTYFLLTGGTAYRVGNRKELIRVLADKKEDVRKFIRRNHLSFKDRFEASLMETAAFYQQTKN